MLLIDADIGAADAAFGIGFDIGLGLGSLSLGALLIVHLGFHCYHLHYHLKYQCTHYVSGGVKEAHMATQKQKAAARRNIKKARAVQSARARGARIPKKSPGLSTRRQNRMPAQTFAFPKERKEPLNDARHVRNAIARFDQVEGVSDSEREAAWRRIKAAAKKFGVEVNERSWRELMRGGKAGSGS